MRPLLVVALLAPSTCGLCAQTPAPQTFEIRGTVIDAGTNQPVPFVPVKLITFTDPKLMSVATMRELDTFVVNHTGSFHFVVPGPGRYQVSVRPEGYVPSQQTVVLTKDAAVHELKILLVREGRVTGRVIDAETKAPMPGLTVVAFSAQWMRGRRFARATAAGTGEDGSFTIDRVRPGEVYAWVYSTRSRDENLMLKFSDKDLEETDTAYVGTYWPGGVDDADAVMPVDLPSGASVSLGTIAISKRKLYRARVSFAGGRCVEGEKVDLELRRLRGGMNGIGAVPCNTDFLIRNLQPGSYSILGSVAGKRRELRPMASGSFHISDKNVKAAMALDLGIEITGKVLAPQTFDPTRLSVSLRPTNAIPFADNDRPNPARDGSFRIRNMAVDEYTLSIAGVPVTHYVKETTYNGGRIRNRLLALDPHASGHSLEVVIGDKPAQVCGRIREDSHDLPDAAVVLVSWPPDSDNIHNSATRTLSDERGAYCFQGLAPGDYRLLAVAGADSEKIERRGVLDGLISQAKELTLSEGAVQNVTLEPLRIR